MVSILKELTVEKETNVNQFNDQRERPDDWPNYMRMNEDI